MKSAVLSITNLIKQSSNIFLCQCMADDHKTQQHWICFIKLTNTQSSNCVIKALISSYKSKKKINKRQTWKRVFPQLLLIFTTKCTIKPAFKTFLI